MRHTILLASALFTASLQAQSSNGYIFIAPGGITCCGNTTMSLHAGLGGEVAIGKGIGAGPEIGALGIRRDFTGSAIGIASVNGYYHFVHGKRGSLDPFVTGGYSLAFRGGHINLFNFGGGLNFWFLRKLGARLEIRDHVHHDGPLHYWGVRFALALR